MAVRMVEPLYMICTARFVQVFIGKYLYRFFFIIICWHLCLQLQALVHPVGILSRSLTLLISFEIRVVNFIFYIIGKNSFRSNENRGTMIVMHIGKHYFLRFIVLIVT